MHDLNPFERRLFNWLSRRSDFTLVSLPMAAFLGIGLLGVVIVSTIAGRSPDIYSAWLITVLVISAIFLYLAIIFCMAVAFLRSRRFKLLDLHQTMRDIQAMSWREFEDLVAANYAAKGYTVEPLGGEGPDGGIDLIARKDNLTWLIQCKHYRNQWVEERPLRELLGVVTARGADGGVLVACGVFDEKALAFAKGNPKLELIGGEQLREMVVNDVRSRPPQITCPISGSAMREKAGRYGAFLGCSNFPSCHGSLPLPSAVRPAHASPR